MPGFQQAISSAARASGDKPILAAPYPLSDVFCRNLIADGIIAGYIAERAPEYVDPAISGWWTNRAKGVWFIRSSVSQSILMLNTPIESGPNGYALLEARIKGIKRILLVEPDGSIVKEVDVATALLALLRSASVNELALQPSYRQLFDDIYSLVGDRLRLPLATLVPGRKLMLIGSLQPGGSERQLAYTATRLAKRCPGQVFVGSSSGGGLNDFFKPYLHAAGVETRTIRWKTDEYWTSEFADIHDELAARYASINGPYILEMIFHYALLISEIRPHLVHTWLDFNNTLGGLAADLVGIPRLIVSSRSVAPENFVIFEPFMAAGYQALLERRNFAWTNNSTAGAIDYARWLGIPRERFSILHNGLEFPEIATASRAAERASLKLSEDAVVIGGMFIFREEKRPFLWLEMASLVHRSHPQTRFVIYGDGPLLPACRKFVEEQGFSNSISLPGLATDTWAAFSAMDIFVLTSRKEGLPNVLIEAQSANIPVICTGAGGMYETFVEGETGFGVREETAEALTEAVIRLIDDPILRLRMGKAAQRHVRESFGIQRMIDQTLATYQLAPECISPFLPDWQAAPAWDTVRLGGIVKVDAHCFAADLPGNRDVSGLNLWENDTLLGPTTESQDEISAVGFGRHRVDGSRIYLSSADGSDPRFNGRTYRLRERPPEPAEIVVSPAVIQPDTGHCFIAELALGKGSSKLVLSEGGVRLGPKSSMHASIRESGGGQYSIWGGSLYFSASDNSDPRTNQRRYVLRREIPSSWDVFRSRIYTPTSVGETLWYLLANISPRTDFVHGRVVHIGDDLRNGAEWRIASGAMGLSENLVESTQLLCFCRQGRSFQDFMLPRRTEAAISVRPIRRQAAFHDPETLPPSLRLVSEALLSDLVIDIADLFWEFLELRPEVVYAWPDEVKVPAGLAAALAGVPQIKLSGRNLDTNGVAGHPDLNPAYEALMRLPHVTVISGFQEDSADELPH
jgi:glycosyltransferase involved in cell wall biosynthesis